MPSIEPRVGVDCLTATGLPVRIVRTGPKAVVVQSLASDNSILVPVGFPLEQLRADKATVAMRSLPYQPYQRRRSETPPKRLAPLIDAMLLAGNKSRRGILRELRRKASTACRGKDLKANVRARLYWLRKRGCQIAMDDGARLRVTSPTAGQDDRI